MARVEEHIIRILIGLDDERSVQPFIDTANVLTDRIQANDSDAVLSTDDLAEIEKYLAAHFCEHRDQAYAQKKTGDASAVFQGQFGLGLDGSKWGMTAKMLDATGYLASIDKGKQVASMNWLGKNPSEQVDYVDRD